MIEDQTSLTANLQQVLIRMKGRLTNPQISLVLGLVSPGIKVGMLKAILSVDLLILVLKSGPRLCLHKM